jgi:hypothetical protein
MTLTPQRLIFPDEADAIAYWREREIKSNSPTSTVLVPAAAGRHHRVMECAPA